ncbi:MAG: toprim domain-containing protein [Spiroplasmataceae bacterium]|nr:toprim domain-containing protein [Spiroplasmataceae bacterium]
MRYKELLNANDILNLLTNKLNLILRQKGRSVFFLCPFHADTNPSCSFEPNRKIFTCFTCGFKASDIFSFWAQYKKINLEESLQEIGQMGYFPLSLIEEKKKEEQKEKNKISNLLTLATDIYKHNLFTYSGKGVLNYLQNKRKIDRSDIERFGFGSSISNRQLSQLLFEQVNNDFSSEDLLTTNLVWITENNKVCDFFPNQQLIIPLENSEGKTVAFAARKINDSVPGESKYRYLPSYHNYQKSFLLYNYSVAKKARTEECYLVEGFFDVISLNKIGIENCIALLGTNLSEEQLKLLNNLNKRIIIFLDNDKAGLEATVNIVIKLLLWEIDCEVVKNDYLGDPDEICHQQNSETVRNMMTQRRKNPYSFILDYLFTKWELQNNPQRTNRFINEVARIFRDFKTNIYEFLVNKISSLTKWEKKEIESHFIKWNFPTLHIKYLQMIYGQELLAEKEKKIVLLCAQERIFWLFISEKKQLFFTKDSRKKYYRIYNYYMLSLFNNSYFKSQLSEKNNNNQELTPANSLSENQSKKMFDASFQALENIKKFFFKNE